MVRLETFKECCVRWDKPNSIIQISIFIHFHLIFLISIILFYYIDIDIDKI